MPQETDVQTQKVTTVSTTTPTTPIPAANMQTQKVTTVATTTPTPTPDHPQQILKEKKVIFRAYQIIWYILAVIEILLGFRMALKALGADPLSGFTNLIYALSSPLALPFSGILQVTQTGNSIIEWSTMIAALVYLVIAYGAVYLMQLIKPVTPHEVEQKVENP